MNNYLLLIVFLLSLFGCEDNSHKTSQSKSVDTILNSQIDSTVKRKGVLEFARKHLSKSTFLSPVITKYIKSGHEPIDSAVGDINGDQILDVLLVTSVINEDSKQTNSILNDKNIQFNSPPFKRQLLVLTGQKGGSFKLECRNSNAIPCLDYCGMTDPFGGISIKNGQIIITEYCASNCKGISEFHFTYIPRTSNWHLDKIIEESYCFDFRDYSLDTVITKSLGKISINLFDISKDL